MAAQTVTASLEPADNAIRDLPFSRNRKREKIIRAELALTDKQSRQWQCIDVAFLTRTKQILQNKALSAEQQRAQLSDVQRDYDSRVKALLSAEQYVKYRQWNAKRQERRRTLQRMEDRQLPGKTAPGKY